MANELWLKVDANNGISGTVDQYTNATSTGTKMKTCESWHDGEVGNYTVYAYDKGYVVKLNIKPTSFPNAFAGWADIGHGASETHVSYTYGAYYGMQDVDGELFPVYTKYTISYNANGGSGAPSSQTKHKAYSIPLSLTVPTRSGYTFKGWSTSAGGSVKYAAGATFSTDANTTLYAVWQANTYTITYDSNGGGFSTSASVTYNTQFTPVQPKRTGYTLLGWATSRDGSVVYKVDGTKYTYTNVGNMTLYAVWSINRYTLTYDANGGTGAPDPVTEAYSMNLLLDTIEPERRFYRFDGWATTKTGSAQYQPGARFIMPAADTTLYAVWTYVYTEPRIIDFAAWRCTEDGTASDNGTYCRVKFDWSTCDVKDSMGADYPVKTLTVSVAGSSDSPTFSQATYKASYSHIFSGIDETEHYATVNISDGVNTTEANRYLPANNYWIDCSPEGGVAVGGVASAKEQFRCYNGAQFDSGVNVSGTTTSNALAVSGTTTLSGNTNAQSLSATSITDTGELSVSGTTTLNGNTNAKALTCTSLSDSGDATVSGLTTLNGLAVRCWSLSGYVGTGTNQKILLRARQTVNASTAGGAINIVGFVGGSGYSDQTKLDVSIPVRSTTTASIKDSSRYSSTAPTYAGIRAYTNSDGYVEVELWVHGYYKVNLIAYFDPSHIQVIDSAWSTTQASQTTWFWSSANPGITRAVLDAYPVGAVYISYVSTSPASLFGGSWTQITGRFLRAANDVSTGGSDSFSMATKGSLIAKSSTEGSQYGLQVNSTAFAGRIVITNSDTFNKQPAYQDLYVWRRTA